MSHKKDLLGGRRTSSRACVVQFSSYAADYSYDRYNAPSFECRSATNGVVRGCSSPPSCLPIITYILPICLCEAGAVHVLLCREYTVHSRYDRFTRWRTDIAAPSVQLPGYDADYSYASLKAPSHDCRSPINDVVRRCSFLRRCGR